MMVMTTKKTLKISKMLKMQSMPLKILRRNSSEKQRVQEEGVNRREEEGAHREERQGHNTMMMKKIHTKRMAMVITINPKEEIQISQLIKITIKKMMMIEATDQLNPIAIRDHTNKRMDIKIGMICTIEL